jgi:hypothetical protein
MHCDKARPTAPLKGLRHTMPVALVRVLFKASQRHALAFSDPLGDFRECLSLIRQAFTLVDLKESVVIGLGVEFAALIRVNAKLREVLVADADPLRRLC